MFTGTETVPGTVPLAGDTESQFPPVVVEAAAEKWAPAVVLEMLRVCGTGGAESPMR
jgi:hypothetical protein